MTPCLDLLNAAAARAGGLAFRFETHQAGALHYRDHGVALPKSAMEAARKADAILLGAMGWPGIRYPDGTEISPQLDLRFRLGLYAGVRPIRAIPGVPVALADPRAAKMDFVILRESTEGLFHARGRGRSEGQGADACVYDTMKITHAGTARVCDFAFELARQRKAQGKRGWRISASSWKAMILRSRWRRIISKRLGNI
jgi:3-isopropylmalate dehydrogenase